MDLLALTRGRSGEFEANPPCAGSACSRGPDLQVSRLLEALTGRAADGRVLV